MNIVPGPGPGSRSFGVEHCQLGWLYAVGQFEQWLYDIACVEVKHYHGDKGIFSSEAYREECSKKMQLQSFSGMGAQHQNSKAEQAIQTIM
jgi:hypothetical protein